MTRPILNRLRATVALLPLAVAIATAGVPAQLAHASVHTLTLAPADTASMLQNSSNFDGFCGVADVGYSHYFDRSFVGDYYNDCVYETAMRFDLSQIHQFPGAIVSKATLTYTDSLYSLYGPNG